MTHIDLQQARDFWKGEGTATERQAILDHLSECERCLDLVDRQWDELPGAVSLDDIPVPGEDDRQRLEQSLFHRIHQMDLIAQVARLGFQGGLAVIGALLRPITPRHRPPHTKGES